MRSGPPGLIHHSCFSFLSHHRLIYLSLQTLHNKLPTGSWMHQPGHRWQTRCKPSKPGLVSCKAHFWHTNSAEHMRHLWLQSVLQRALPLGSVTNDQWTCFCCCRKKEKLDYSMTLQQLLKWIFTQLSYSKDRLFCRDRYGWEYCVMDLNVSCLVPKLFILAVGSRLT